MGEQTRASDPLWRYLQQGVQRPRSPRAPRAPSRAKARRIREEDLDLVRDDGSWRPSAVLERFGPAKDDADYLANTLIAQLILLGPERIEAACALLLRRIVSSLPRLRQLGQDEGLALRRRQLGDLERACVESQDELAVARVRARNDLSHPPSGERLRWLDVWAIRDAVRRWVLLEELCKQQSVAGLDFVRGRCSQRPAQAELERWSRVLVGATGAYLLFTPREYGRVVVVHRDGRLLYDAGAAAEPQARR